MSSDQIPTGTISEANPEPCPASNRPARRHWRFQFSLRTLLLFVSVVGVLCGYLGMFIQSAQKQRKAVAQIQRLGGQVNYDYEFGHHDSPPTPPGPSFLRRIFGEDAFANVKYVSLYSETNTIRDEDLIVLRELPKVDQLYLWSPGITDRGMKIVAENRNLQQLSLVDVNISGDGLMLFGKNERLESLYLHAASIDDSTISGIETQGSVRCLILRKTGLTDAGLASVARLLQLRELNLCENSGFTGKGLESVAKLTNLKSLYLLGNSGMVDGFEHLKGLTKLKLLWIYAPSFDDGCAEILRNLKELQVLKLPGAAMSDQGVEKLRNLKELLGLNLSDTAVSDQSLETIRQLERLEQLDLSGTKITVEGLSRLKCLAKMRVLCVGPGITKADLAQWQKDHPDCAIQLIDTARVVHPVPPGEK
jgi:hypothetical protein